MWQIYGKAVLNTQNGNTYFYRDFQIFIQTVVAYIIISFGQKKHSQTFG